MSALRPGVRPRNSKCGANPLLAGCRPTTACRRTRFLGPDSAGTDSMHTMSLPGTHGAQIMRDAKSMIHAVFTTDKADVI